MRGSAPGPAGAGWVDVRFTYDLNGILEVEMQGRWTTERVEHLVIESRPGQLTGRRSRGARRWPRIKFHPRDSLPNPTALARADALFAETSGPSASARPALAAFRAVLETQEPDMIDPTRERLNAFIASLRG